MNTRIARILTVLIAAVGIQAAAPAAHADTVKPATARAAAAHCAGAGELPSGATLRRSARATLCLLNAERRAHGLATLHPNRKLRRSAGRYARAMVSRHFFSHVAPNGQTLEARMSRSGYLRGANGWAYGENLAWGSGTRATPREIVAAWMASAGHRANILSGRFRHIGIGVATGAPEAVNGPAASYVTHFGWRG
jgi:uncharacterized protein YkwD